MTVPATISASAAINQWTTWSMTVPVGETFTTKFHSMPKDYAEDFQATEAASFGLPYLREVRDTPYFNSERKLILADGYDPASGILLNIAADLKIAPVSQNPSDAEIADAVWWLQELYVDTPFSDGETDVDLDRWWKDRDYRMTIGKGSRANQLAKVIQPFVSEMIAGNLVLHGVDKVMRRTGAGYVQDALGIVCFGIEPAGETLPYGEEEIEKRIVTKAMEGERHVVWDNAKEGRVIASDCIASTLTSGKIKGRELGFNRTGGGAWRCVTEINGNGLTLHEDLAARCLWVLLDAHVKAPEGRRHAEIGYAHDPYQQWVRVNRGRFVRAILTIIQAWIARGGREMQDHKRIIGGFEQYCRVVGGILDGCGIGGFNTNRELISVDKTQVDEVQAFMGHMLDVFGTEAVKVGRGDAAEEPDTQRRANCAERTLVELLIDVSADLTLGLYDHPNTRSLGLRLGHKLGTYKGRPYEIGGREFTFMSRTVDGSQTYWLKPKDGKPMARKIAGSGVLNPASGRVGPYDHQDSRD
jgi:hypothetical protein